MNMMDALISNYPRIAFTLVAFLIYLLSRRLSARSVFKRAITHSFDESRAMFIRRVIRSVITITFLVVLGIIWEVSIQGLSLYIASFLTVVGVGLFATWSVVSNITASVILFFFFPFRIGSQVKIIDGDNSVQGTVMGLSLFSIRIKLADETEVFYPNNLAMQKGIIHLTPNDGQD